VNTCELVEGRRIGIQNFVIGEPEKALKLFIKNSRSQLSGNSEASREEAYERICCYGQHF
jgi:hypothetical protein